MKWEGGECKISDGMAAEVWPPFSGMGDNWWACVKVINGDDLVWCAACDSQEAAKAAVCHWIGRTMAQFSNALAAGCNEQDDGA